MKRANKAGCMLIWNLKGRTIGEKLPSCHPFGILLSSIHDTARQIQTFLVCVYVCVSVCVSVCVCVCVCCHMESNVYQS